MKLIGFIKKQQSTVGETGVVGQVVIEFISAKNPGAIADMPLLQEAGLVAVEIEPAQGNLFKSEGSE